MGIIIGVAVVALIWGGVYVWRQKRKQRRRFEELGLQGKPI